MDYLNNKLNISILVSTVRLQANVLAFLPDSGKNYGSEQGRRESWAGSRGKVTEIFCPLLASTSNTAHAQALPGIYIIYFI